MAEYVPPKINTQFIFYVALRSQADSTIFQVNPTIAAGDFKVSIDGGATANPGTLPAVTPAGGKAVKITLSSSEMNGDNIFVYASDAAGAEWMDAAWCIQTGARQIVDLAFPTTSGRSIDVATTGEVGLDLANMNFPVGAIPALGIVDNGTLQSATGTTAVLRAAASFGNSRLVGATLHITGGTGVGQSRVITGYVDATDTATVDTWDTTPDNTSTYVVFAGPPASTSSPIPSNMLQVNGTTQTARDLGANVDVAVSTRLASSGVPANFSAMSITAGGLVDITQGAADKVWGTAARTLTSLGTTLVQEVWDRATANLTTAGSIGKLVVDNVNATISSVKAQTDKLTFDGSNNVAANVKRINDTAVIGTGISADKWRA